MKMKRLLANLSLIASIQVLFMAFGGAFVAELISASHDKALMYIAGVLCFIAGGTVTGLYFRLFATVDKQKRK